MVTLLLPLNRYKVNYELGKGRPYSQLEQLVLRSFKEEGANTIEKLQDIFCLPNRLIVEILVTLAQAGWIALNNNQEGAFILTSQGEKVLNSSDRQLPSGTNIRSAETFVMMERFMGGVISPSEIIYLNNKELNKKKLLDFSHKLPVRIPNDTLGIEQVQHFLPRDKKEGERIRFIAPLKLSSADYYWLPMNADLQQQRIIGLPDRWKDNLEELLLKEAEEFAHRYPEKAKQSYDEVRTIEYPKNDQDNDYVTQINLHDLLLTHQAHVEQLKNALAEAKNIILIASAFINPDCLSEIREWLIEALQRNVTVDLLWGYSPTNQSNQSEKNLKKWLENLAKQVKKSQGKLRFNERPTNSHAKLLVYDTEEGYKGYVGSYNWLSTPIQIQSNDNDVGNNVTVGLNHKGLLADLCFTIASLWDTGHNHLSSDAPGHWQRIAMSLQEETESHAKDKDKDEKSSKVRVLHTQNHEGEMRKLLKNAQKRCLVVSHQIASNKEVAEFRLIKPLEKLSEKHKLSFEPIVLYGEQKRLGDDEESFQQKVETFKGILKYKEGLHSKVMVVDDVAIISSYNFLSGDPSNRANQDREIGVLIEGGEIPNKLWQVFSEVLRSS